MNSEVYRYVISAHVALNAAKLLGLMDHEEKRDNKATQDVKTFSRQRNSAKAEPCSQPQ